jgi:hypothetical protein
LKPESKPIIPSQDGGDTVSSGVLPLFPLLIGRFGPAFAGGFSCAL